MGVFLCHYLFVRGQGNDFPLSTKIGSVHKMSNEINFKLLLLFLITLFSIVEFHKEQSVWEMESHENEQPHTKSLSQA